MTDDTYTKQIDQWYENAEQITKTNLPNDGDTIIYPGQVEGSYMIEPNTKGWDAQIVFENEECRILDRAPVPKPAWHDSAVVRASTVENMHILDLFINDGGTWRSFDGDFVNTDELRDVTPLIEARVTDEMVQRGRDIGVKGKRPDSELVRRILVSALGVDGES